MQEIHQIHPTALFRHSVLGPLVSRDSLNRGELCVTFRKLASESYQIPGGSRVKLSERTIESWYYAYLGGGVDALAPKTRSDKGRCHLSDAVKQVIASQKKAFPKRSINRIINRLETDGIVASGTLSRSSVHRFLVSKGLNQLSAGDSKKEHRSFEAPFVGRLWQGDVMHGPTVLHNGRKRKSYLVSWMDDMSRLMTHSEFRISEQKEEIEYVLKQAIIKRGLPYNLYIDNGPAYRSRTLQEACARLQIHIIYCKAYSPESKGKIERWHGTVRGQFLAEIGSEALSLSELNERYWRWLEQEYHQTQHTGTGETPNERYQTELNRVRPLGQYAIQLDDLFLHRHKRKVRKDGTISYKGVFYEVPFQLVSDTVMAVVQPETDKVTRVESLEGDVVGKATLLDKVSNNQRVRN